MTKENKKPETEAHIQEKKRQYARLLADAKFWADDLGMTLEEFFSKHKKV